MLSFIVTSTAMSMDPVMKLRVNTRTMMSVHDANNNFPVTSAMHRAVASYYQSSAPLPSCVDAKMLHTVDDMEASLSENLKQYLRDLESGF
uniref:Uncharacterized protein n=1 Tax=viral metagenome TaxID=1070528 RepID=A0A6C0LRX8_9ZZZZ